MTIQQRVQLARCAACEANGVTMLEITEILHNNFKSHNPASRARYDMIATLHSELPFMGFRWATAQAGYVEHGGLYERVYEIGRENKAAPFYEDLVKRLTGK